ncbi:MAG: hypothetical protein MJ048_00885 [Acidaminococcaceae bacterium]|nr:hypothetical protein [Acidaminococcaceae bacterium]
MDIVDFSKFRKFNRYVKYTNYEFKFFEDLIYDNCIWKLKYSPSFQYECYSEYIGSHIFDILGMQSQETLLGTCQYGGKRIPVVACKDFTTDRFLKFIDLVEMIGSQSKKEKNLSHPLEDTIFFIKSQTMVDSEVFLKYFYKIIFIDLYIDNPDRIWRNFGFFIKDNEHTAIAPVFDNGDCLYSVELSHDINFIYSVLSKIQLNNYSPRSDFYGTEKILYRLNFLQDDLLKEALCWVVDAVNERKHLIENMIEDISLISEREKEFYKILLTANHKFLSSLRKEYC